MKQVQCISKDCQVWLLFSSRIMDQIHLIKVSMTKKTLEKKNIFMYSLHFCLFFTRFSLKGTKGRGLLLPEIGTFSLTWPVVN